MSSLDEQTFKGTERFLIQHQLGAGAFGTVYQAYDREKNTVVALKVLRQTDPNALYRFKKEFRALVDVTHPNLVALYELMSTGNIWFFTMELVKGVNFLTYVREGASPADLSSFESNGLAPTVPNEEDSNDRFEGAVETLKENIF